MIGGYKTYQGIKYKKGANLVDVDIEQEKLPN
jgi:hypothetical protein